LVKKVISSISEETPIKSTFIPDEKDTFFEASEKLDRKENRWKKGEK